MERVWIFDAFEKKQMRQILSNWAVIGAVLFLIFPFCSAYSEVVTDGSVGSAGPIAGPNYAIVNTLGTQSGGNLFHSFSAFNVSAGEVAIFSGPASVQRIITRITGGQLTTIDGTLRSTIAGADFYLLNPSGVLFNQNASLDMSGSLFVSTANALTFSDGTVYAIPAVPGAILTAATPESFGFTTTAPAEITVANPILALANNQRLALIGGDIAIRGPAVPVFRPTLTVVDGNLEFVSVAGLAQVALGNQSLSISSNATLGQVSIGDRAFVSVNGFGGGRIQIQSNTLLINGGSFIDNSSFGINPSGLISLDVQNSFTLTESSFVLARNAAAGATPIIRVNAGSFNVQGGSQLGSVVFGSGQGNNVDINVLGEIRVEGSFAGNSSALISVTQATGTAGNLNIQAASLVVDGGLLQSVQAVGGSGDSGDINLDVGRFSVVAGGQVEVGTNGTGSGGNLNVDATQAVEISGSDVNGTRSSLISSSVAAGGANAGNIRINSPVLTINDGVIESGTLDGGGGNIVIEAGQVDVLGGGQVFTTSRGTGNSGNLQIQTTGNLTLKGMNTGGQRSGVFANALSTGTGGDINLQAGDGFQLLAGARLAVDARGTGNAGTVSINATSVNTADSAILATATQSAGGNINLNARQIVLDATPVSATVFGGAGGGGNITINSTNLVALNGSDLTARADQGLGGNIQLNADVFLRTPDIDLDASSNVIGNDGRVEINAPEQDVASDLARLQAPPTASAQRSSACSPGQVNNTAPPLDVQQGLSAFGPWPSRNSGNRDYRKYHHQALQAWSEGKVGQATALFQQAYQRALKPVDGQARSVEAGIATLADRLAMAANEPPAKQQALLKQLLALSGDAKASAAQVVIAASGALTRLEISQWPLKTLFQAARKGVKTSVPGTLGRAQALAAMAGLYAYQGHHNDAARLYQQASHSALLGQAVVWAAEWATQQAKQEQASGQTRAALASWQRSSDWYWQQRKPLAQLWRAQGSNFRLKAGVVFEQIVRQQLSQSQLSQQTLRSIQNQWERLKVAELAEYNGDCLLAQAQPLSEAQQADPGSVVVYPILLEDRLELLVQRGAGELERRKVDVGREEINQTLDELLNTVESKGDEARIRRLAQRLYQWLVAPIEHQMQGSKTLVLVPDGRLRMLPPGLLHDGKQYLIERMASAAIPGLSLLRPPNASPAAPELASGEASSVTEISNGRILLAGADSVGVINAVKELNNLQSLLGAGRATLVSGGDYRLERLQNEVRKRRYRIMHLASHARFDSAQGSGLLVTTAHGGEINAQQISELVALTSDGGRPLELLTLSACETARGDDRVALGLGGIAARTGARSALATLWRTDDESAYYFMEAFYRYWQDHPEEGRAQAARAAALHLRHQEEFQHPVHWAEFLLIGDWRG